MVRHVILWKLKDEYTPDQKAAIKAGMKTGLEALVGKVPGLVSVKVHINGLPSSSGADAMLDSVLEDETALKNYAVHPEHVAVADSKVRPFLASRVCLDFEEN